MRTLVMAALLTYLSITAQASACDSETNAQSSITVQYIGNTAIKGRDWSIPQGKYVLKNNSGHAIEFAGYKSVPVTLYGHDTQIEKQTPDGQWISDIIVLEEFLPPNRVIKLKPNSQQEFAADIREDTNSTYRIKVRAKNGCWITSQPFHFSSTKG